MSNDNKQPDKLLEECKKGQIPDDLQWMVEQFHMQPNDAAFLLLVWYWVRVSKFRDEMHEEACAFRASIEVTTEEVQKHLTDWQQVSEVITGFQEHLGQSLQTIGQDFKTDIHESIVNSLNVTQQLEARLNGLLNKIDRRAHYATWHIAIGSFLAGVAVGISFIPWTLLRYFSHS